MTDVDLANFFAEPSEPEFEPPADRQLTHTMIGTMSYYDNLPPVPGHGPGPWLRVSELDIFSSTYYLDLWHQRQVVRAIEQNQRDLAAAPMVEDLLKPMRGSRFNAATSHGKRVLNKIVEACHDLIGSHKGSDIGTRFHEFCERLDAGESPKAFDLSPELRAMLRAYWELRREYGIQPVPGHLERTVFIPELQAAGTFDHLDTIEGRRLPVIGDTKSQGSMNFSNIAIPQQLASYAHAKYVLNKVTWTWEPMPKVDQELAVVLWCPADDPGEASVQDIDIVKGWEFALDAVKCLERREDHTTITRRPWPGLR
jgi:hypothetical protein